VRIYLRPVCSKAPHATDCCSPHRRVFARWAQRVASLVLSIIIFPKFTEGRLPSQSPHGTLFSFGPAETILAGAADNRALSRAAA
jgi:hypothetical protein